MEKAKKKHPHRRRFLWALFILFWILLLVFLYYYITSLFLHVEHYTVEANVSSPIRIVQLSDLHNAEFGEDNSKLIEKVAGQRPDAIFMTGDMLNEDDENVGIVVHLVTELSKIAPVYYCYGNHETAWERNYKKDLHQILGAAGATVLECEYVDTEMNGNPVRIGGYMGYWGQPHMVTNDPEEKERHSRFFRDFKEKDLPERCCRILLDHIPTSWLDWHYIDTLDTGIVFSGHYHGGVIRIPILDQGVAAPYVGWWPPYTKGLYVGEKSTCILSAGLGIEHGIPRLNNPPEIVAIDLIPKTETAH